MRYFIGAVLLLLGLGGVFATPDWQPGWRVLLGLLAAGGLATLLIHRKRWLVAVMLCVVVVNNYMDRNTLALARAAIVNSGDIAIGDSEWALLNSCFLFSYAAMYVIGGKLLDVVGTRWGLMLITIFWSLAVISHGFAQTLWGLAACRLLLGIGEGGVFPAATRGVAEWFPAKEKSTAMGIINAGTAVGGMLAPPLAPLIINYSGWPGAAWGLADPWRWVFFLCGATGFVWCLWWLAVYRPARSDNSLSLEERRELAEVLEADAHPAAAAAPTPWLALLANRYVLALMLCKFLGDAVWYFIVFWLPKYLEDVHHFNIKQVGNFAWMPWLGAGVGCVLVGSASSWLISRGFSVNASRKIALGAAVSVMPCLLLLTVIKSPAWQMVPFIIAYFGQQAWSTLVMTIPADMFPRRQVGAVAGLVGCGGALGGIVFGQLSGAYLDTHHLDYGPIFVVASFLHILSFIVILVLIPRIEPVGVSARTS